MLVQEWAARHWLSRRRPTNLKSELLRRRAPPFDRLKSTLNLGWRSRGQNVAGRVRRGHRLDVYQWSARMTGHEERLLDDDNHPIVIRYLGPPNRRPYELLRDYLELRLQRMSGND